METIELSKNVQLHVHPTTQFKDVAFYMDILMPLTSSGNAARMVLSFALSDCCQKYPDKVSVAKVFDEMYGAELSCNYRYRGKASIFEMRVNVINGRFVNDVNLLKKQFQLAKEFLCFPKKNGELFDEELFLEAKKKAISVVHGIHDEPMELAPEKAYQIYGDVLAQACSPSVEEIQAVTNEEVMQQYKQILQQGSIDFFVLGDVDVQQCARDIQEMFSFEPREGSKDIVTLCNRQEVVEKTDQAPLQQSVLVCLYNTKHNILDPMIPAMMLGNGILGALPTSLLFQEVREKRSLCYTISSENDVYAGVLRITTAMEAKNVPQAKQLIAEQIEKIKKGEFTQEMLDTARKMYINSWRSTKDSARAMLWDDYRSVLLHQQDSIEQMIARFEKVTKEQVMEVFQTVELKVTYLYEALENGHE